MQHIIIKQATSSDYQIVASLVKDLLLELDPEYKEEIEKMKLSQITKDLFTKKKIHAFIANTQDIPIGVLTLHECAAIYAGGIFGEISELFVQKKYRSSKIGQKLLSSAIEYANQQGWCRLEVGAPNSKKWSRTIDFYIRNGFQEVGPRLRLLT